MRWNSLWLNSLWLNKEKEKENALISLHLRFNTQWFLIWDFLIIFYIHFLLCYYHPLKAWGSVLDLLPLYQCSLYIRGSKPLCYSKQWSLFFCTMTSFCFPILILLANKISKISKSKAQCPSFILIDLSIYVLKNI